MELLLEATLPSPKREKNSSKVDALQALRALAAVLVILFHLNFSPELLGFEFASGKFIHGILGVDVFFVLSGFIITTR